MDNFTKKEGKIIGRKSSKGIKINKNVKFGPQLTY